MTGNTNNNQNNNNQNPPAPPAQPASRFGNRNNNNNNTNNNQNNNNQNPPAPPARPSRFGSRSSNNTNNNNQPSSRFGSRPGTNPFGSNNNQTSWTLTPLESTIVRFDLRGLGDPFYRLLGQDLNEDYGDSRAVTKALEAGGEAVLQMQELLDAAWEGYGLHGASLVYNWNEKIWKGVMQPTPMPTPFDDIFDDDDEEDQQPTPPPTRFKCLRAIDLQLVINVLARSRSQLLLGTAPLVMSQQYLNRSLVTDDPRLVNLVKATGYLEG